MATLDSLARGGVSPGDDRTATASLATPADPASAVSWGAILAGAAGAAALSMILLILGVGLGLSSVSPWSQNGIGAGTFGVSTVVWLTFTSLAASGMGGYLAGRLRSRWHAVHTDEVYFRDTAHGFLAWAVASLATAAMLGSAIGSIVSGAAQAGASVAGGAASAVATAAGGAAAGTAGRGGDDASGSGPMSYYVDSLMRKATAPAAAPASTAADTAASSAPAMSPAPTPADGGPAPSAEVSRIFANAMRTGSLGADDTRYLGQLVAQRTGLSQPEGEKRVTDTFGRMKASLQDAENTAKDAADKARKATAYASLWMFVSLLAGAFVASWAATFGGRRRDF